jgi:micrococcal nuclease
MPALSRPAAAGLAAALIAWCLTACASTPSTGSTGGVVASELPRGDQARVERVVDGDTLLMADRSRIRLIGIDTPETVAPGRPVECFGPEAAATTRRLLPPGTLVRLVDDRERFDRFDRRLAYVYRVEDGLFVNATLVAEGAARARFVPPNERERRTLTTLEDQARADRRGLWGACP